MSTGSVKDLQGKRILVTGSSRGIGRAIARELAARGATLVVHGPPESEELRASYQDVRKRSPSSILVGADLSHSDRIAALFETIERQLGGLDVLVNNAATQNPSPLVDLEEKDWDHVLTVNLKAPFLCAQHAARLMRSGGRGGKIINISSVHAHAPRRNYAHYSTAKAGLEQLTRCLALELAEYNIQANAVVVGAVATELTPPDRQAAFATAVPAGRVGTVDEIARVVAFLAGNECDYLTGASVTVDGGLTLGFCASRRDL
jgi:NAD(P)-dependent dehydrogenase (short-subunit alcohol dehydrogenase family)